MAGVFPESFNKPDFSNVRESLEKIYDYIQYICERTDFAVTGVSRNASQVGSTGLEVLERLAAVEGATGGLQTSVNTMRGDVNALQTSVASITQRFPVTQPIIAEAAPTQDTAGLVGQQYVDTVNENVYSCTKITEQIEPVEEGEPIITYTYTWKRLDNA